jgi:hypothetical protein
MAESEQNYLLELWDRGVCPNCGKKIPAGKRVGSGKKSDGGFCSLDCYGEYYSIEIFERAKKVSALTERHRKS